MKLSDVVRIMRVHHYASGRSVALERRNEIADKIVVIEAKLAVAEMRIVSMGRYIKALEAETSKSVLRRLAAQLEVSDEPS